MTTQEAVPAAMETTVTKTKTDAKRVLQLDILRGVAILLVIAMHSQNWEPGEGIASAPARILFRLGWTGVELFFVLSGFLIGGLLFGELRDKGSLDVPRFIIRRIFKIWPSYYLLLIVVAIMMAMMPKYGSFGVAFDTTKAFWFHVQNYNSPDVNNHPFLFNIAHAWSLGIEEHFYLVLPIFLWIVSRFKIDWRKSDIILQVGFGLIFLCTFGRGLDRFLWSGDLHGNPTAATHMRIDALFCGVTLAYIKAFRPEYIEKFTNTIKKRMLLLLAGSILWLPMAAFKWTHWFVATVGITMVYLGFGMILLAVVFTPLGEGWFGKLLASPLGRLLARIGIYSYSIYLWHMLIGQRSTLWILEQGWFKGIPPLISWWIYTFFFALIATVAGALLSIIVEYPMLAIRDKLFPSRHKKNVVA